MAVVKLPQDVEMDILSRLPVESLVRFRCVSKRFRSLISDPYFIKLHLNRSILSNSTHKVLLFTSSCLQSTDYESLLDDEDNNINDDDDNNALVKLDWPLCRPHRVVIVIGSCNGLICYLGVGVGLYEALFLYNPSIRVSKEMPRPPITIPLLSSMTSGNCEIYGFGFDDSNNDYKVLMAIYTVDHASNRTRFRMYSLRHNSWRTIQDPAHNYKFYSKKGIFFNGALHWIGIGSEEVSVILCFDLSKEIFSEMSLDIVSKGNPWFYKLGAFEECLYALTKCDDGECFYKVWLMKEYGVEASWTKFITIPLSVGYWLTPLCFLRNGELLLDSNGTNLGSYNAKEMTFTRIRSYHSFPKPVSYVESLVFSLQH